jgi:site-specific recombinase XerD
VKDDQTPQEKLLQLAARQAAQQGKSVARYLRELQAAFARQERQERQEHQEKVAARDTAPAQHKTREKYVTLTRGEVARLFAQMTDERDRVLFAAMYYFGLRASEVGLLRREHVNFTTRQIHIPRLKSGVAGEKVMTTEYLRLLRDYVGNRSDSLPYLFPSRNARPVSRQRIDRLFRMYAEQANISLHKRHSHCLRHSIAAHLLDAGHTLEDVQDHLGHKSIHSTVVYSKVSSGSSPKRKPITIRIQHTRISGTVVRITKKPV